MYDFESLISSTYYESKAKFDKNRFIMKQDFYFSKDGTRIPIFIAHEKKLVLDNMAPTLLYGYGGFNISEKPYFNKTIPVILENGGVYAIACIRGGGEYGQDWHSQGMLSRKQNVFDDFISAAEFLMVQGFTSTEKLAIQGGSNGGTLIGAVINQRPDLFQVAFPEVGVMDMLRYEKFTIGWAWAVEFGSVENEKDFENLLSYSPLHNIKKASYPSVLIYTADHDDRVVPAHSYKYAAKLQKNQMSDANPILIRIGTKTGHGAGKSTKARIRETAEKWAFMFYEMGIKY
jgi:prolyl oligopeptidase